MALTPFRELQVCVAACRSSSQMVAFVIALTLSAWLSTASADPVLDKLCAADGQPDFEQVLKSNVGFVPAEAVTNALPAEGDARIVYKRPLEIATPQRFRIFEPAREAEINVVSAETPGVEVNADYPIKDSVVLHVDIPRQRHLFPLWHRRDFRVVECAGNQFKSWASVRAYVSSPFVAYWWIIVSLTVFALSISAVHQSREAVRLKTGAEGRLAEKYPSVFASKPFETIDFFNPIQLTSNAFNQASVQKFQVLMFSFIVGSLVLSLVLRTGTLSDLSMTVVGLLGISGVGAAVSQITYTTKTRLSFENWAWLQTHDVFKKTNPRGPEWKDLVLTNREFDVYKLQTIIFSLAVAVALIFDGASNLASFQVPPTMLEVLGLSQVVFVGGILVRPPATEDLDKAIDALRGAAHNFTEALARGTDVGPDGKLLAHKPLDTPVADNARRQYLELVDSTIPMIESTLEVEVNDDALRDAPLPDEIKKNNKRMREMAA